MSFQDNLTEAVTLGISFTSSTGLISVPDSRELPVVFFKNPGPSKVRINFAKMRFGTDSVDTRTTLQIYANPDITEDGTVLTADNKFISDQRGKGKAKLFLWPSISRKGNLLNTYILPENSQTVTDTPEYMLDPGKTILITIKNSATNKRSHIDLDWIEIPLS